MIAGVAGPVVIGVPLCMCHPHVVFLDDIEGSALHIIPVDELTRHGGLSGWIWLLLQELLMRGFDYVCGSRGLRVRCEGRSLVCAAYRLGRLEGGFVAFLLPPLLGCRTADKFSTSASSVVCHTFSSPETCRSLRHRSIGPQRGTDRVFLEALLSVYRCCFVECRFVFLSL